MLKRRNPNVDHWQARRREYLAEAGRHDDLKREEREWREQAERPRAARQLNFRCEKP
jgi:hypothetical protein